MATVKFTYALKRFYPELNDIPVAGKTVADVLKEVEAGYPGIRDYIVHENGALRKHVNIFIGNTLISDRTALSDPVAERDEVYIMQALSGG